MHWAERFVGRSYIPGVRDCASFCEEVLREQFGRMIRLPSERADSLAGQTQQIIDLHRSYGTPTQTPAEGDAVLMTAKGGTRWHLGLYCCVNGSPHVLHCEIGSRQACLHRIRDLDRYGLECEGFYQWA